MTNHICMWAVVIYEFGPASFRLDGRSLNKLETLRRKDKADAPIK